MEKPGFFVTRTAGYIGHYGMAGTIEDAVAVFSVLLGRPIRQGLVERHCDVGIIPLTQAMYDEHGTGYYVHAEGVATNIQQYVPVNIRQYYIDLALEYIEHEASI